MLNSQRGNKCKYIAKAQRYDNCFWFSFFHVEKAIPEAHLIRSHSFHMYLYPSAGTTGARERCAWRRSPRGAAQWGNHEETLCPRLPLSEQRRRAETMDLLRGRRFIHPRVQPVIDGGSGGQQTLGAQPLNTLSKMAKGHALQ